MAKHYGMGKKKKPMDGKKRAISKAKKRKR